MSDEDELSEDELNALISDLESRSDGGGGGDLEADAPEGEDLEALMQEVDRESPDSSVGSKDADREGPEAGPDLSNLDVADELPAETEGAAPDPTAGRGEGEREASSDQSSGGADSESNQTDSVQGTSGEASDRSKAWGYLWTVVKWTGYTLPVVACWWMLGSYLGQWVSAGWLIAIVATMAVIGLPKALYDLADRRGRFRWWLAGTTLVMATVLVAPMSESAGESLTQYGHWPATAVAEASGATGGVVVDTNAAIGEWIGRRLAPGLPAEEGMRDLGQ